MGDRSVGGIRIGLTVPREAIALFGGPRLLQPDRASSCLGSWPEIGLSIRFFSFDSDPCWAGVAVAVTIISHDAWRTALGLRVRDSVARLRRLYPEAPRQTQFVGTWNGYWLITRSACSQTGRWRYPALLARVRQGRVTALVASGSVCDIS